MKTTWEKLQRLAIEEIETLFEELPKPVRERASALPIIFERAPSAELQANGIEADTFGLFVGAEMADQSIEVMPPQIILFLENLWILADGDEKTFCDEVRTTFLHELGHFFGLGEDELFERGLE